MVLHRRRSLFSILATRVCGLGGWFRPSVSSHSGQRDFRVLSCRRLADAPTPLHRQPAFRRWQHGTALGSGDPPAGDGPLPRCPLGRHPGSRAGGRTGGAGAMRGCRSRRGSGGRWDRPRSRERAPRERAGRGRHGALTGRGTGLDGRRRQGGATCSARAGHAAPRHGLRPCENARDPNRRAESPRHPRCRPLGSCRRLRDRLPGGRRYPHPPLFHQHVRLRAEWRGRRACERRPLAASRPARVPDRDAAGRPRLPAAAGDRLAGWRTGRLHPDPGAVRLQWAVPAAAACARG